MSRPVFLHVLILKPGGFFGGVVFFLFGFFFVIYKENVILSDRYQTF